MEILIIGGIAAGMSTAAKALRTNKNAKVTVVEQEDYVSFGACGLPYFIGGQFDDENNMYARTPKQMLDAGVNLLLKHRAERIDFKNKQVIVKDLDKDKLKTLSYDRLMIATGASAIKPKMDGIESKNVYTVTKPYIVRELVKNLDSYNKIVVVGGGFIGVEVAEQLAHLNKEVDLLHSREFIMDSAYDKEISKLLTKALIESGVNFIPESKAVGLKVEDGVVTGVKTKDDTYKADAVIIAVGFKPNTKFLDNQLETLDNGAIIIDKYGQTSIKDVFAAGDCATVPHRLAGNEYIPLATYANKYGRIIGENIVSEKENWQQFNGALGSSSIKVGAYEAVVTGLTEDLANKFNYKVNTTLIQANNHSNYYPNQEKITIKLVYDKETFVLYGAQIFGPSEAVLRGTGLSVAVYAGLTTKDLGFLDFAYSPPFASTWEAINIAANTAK